MAIAVQEQQQCDSCVFYRPENRYCSRWKQVTEPSHDCGGYRPANAGGPVTVSYLAPAEVPAEEKQPEEAGLVE